jgi:pyruvate ferredoxin oxidoreductase gamma subunit
MVFEIRLHGRGGQGVVTAAELLSVAAFLEGFEAQAFPSFGSERMGAPVVSFCRINDRPIRVREPVTRPDAVIVIDATLVHHVDLFAGLNAGGYVLINSSRAPAELGLDDLIESQPAGQVVTVAATDLAREYLGRPLPNICLLGAFAALTGRVSLSSIETAVRDRFSGPVADANIRAARASYAVAERVRHA